MYQKEQTSHLSSVQCTHFTEASKLQRRFALLVDFLDAASERDLGKHIVWTYQESWWRELAHHRETWIGALGSRRPTPLVCTCTFAASLSASSRSTTCSRPSRTHTPARGHAPQPRHGQCAAVRLQRQAGSCHLQLGHGSIEPVEHLGRCIELAGSAG